ncbi:MAG: hypothetical protein AAGA75_14825 [Cyanobacteria bacterium P01_E01_bin.6]
MILQLERTMCPDGDHYPASEVSHRLLLIEDSDDIQTVIRLGLELIAGIEVLVAKVDDDWVALAQAKAVDLILVDEPSNRDNILLELQRDPLTKDIPLVCIVPRDRHQDQAKARRQGASAVIAKPFDLVVLASIISEILSHPSKSSESLK